MTPRLTPCVLEWLKTTFLVKKKSPVLNGEFLVVCILRAPQLPQRRPRASRRCVDEESQGLCLPRHEPPALSRPAPGFHGWFNFSPVCPPLILYACAGGGACFVSRVRFGGSGSARQQLSLKRQVKSGKTTTTAYTLEEASNNLQGGYQPVKGE